MPPRAPVASGTGAVPCVSTSPPFVSPHGRLYPEKTRASSVLRCHSRSNRTGIGKRRNGTERKEDQQAATRPGFGAGGTEKPPPPRAVLCAFTRSARSQQQQQQQHESTRLDRPPSYASFVLAQKLHRLGLPSVERSPARSPRSHTLAPRTALPYVSPSHDGVSTRAARVRRNISLLTCDMMGCGQQRDDAIGGPGAGEPELSIPTVHGAPPRAAGDCS